MVQFRASKVREINCVNSSLPYLHRVSSQLKLWFIASNDVIQAGNFFAFLIWLNLGFLFRIGAFHSVRFFSALIIWQRKGVVCEIRVSFVVLSFIAIVGVLLNLLDFWRAVHQDIRNLLQCGNFAFMVMVSDLSQFTVRLLTNDASGINYYINPTKLSNLVVSLTHLSLSCWFSWSSFICCLIVP